MAPVANPFADRPSSPVQRELLKSQLEAQLAELDHERNCPENCDVSVFRRMCSLRRSKIDWEVKVRQMALQLAEMVAFLERRQNEDEANRREKDSLSALLTQCVSEGSAGCKRYSKKLQYTDRVRDGLKAQSNNVEVQLLLKQGQVEVDAGSYVFDFAHSLLISRPIVEALNKRILELGEGKIAKMLESKDFRKGIVQLEWEQKRMIMQLEDLQTKIHKINHMKVTREIQKFLKDPVGYEDQIKKEIETLELTIKKCMKLREVKKEAKTKELATVKKKSRSVEARNEQMRERVELLSVELNERRNIMQTASAAKADSIGAAAERHQEIVVRRQLTERARAQADVLAQLRTEVERWRMKTFPALVQLKR